MLIDTHAHVSDPKFNADRAEVLERARAAGVGAMIDVGISVATSRRAIALAGSTDGVFAAVGIHPHDAHQADDEAMAAIRALAAAPKVVAIGETGLDFYRDRAPHAEQDRALRAHLDLAAALDLPVILHLRSSAVAGEGAQDAYEACIAVLEGYRGAVRGVSHCFSGTPELAARLVDLGFLISFAGNVTYPKAPVLREAAAAIPLEAVLVETDCPYLAPQPKRGKRNEPAYVRMTAEAVAAARGMPVAALAEAATANARRLFGLPGPGA